jgi:ADP-dependent NAD(P)H-hydrate dehydratase / NAD(P)H-hydrate epimerase
VIPVLTPEEMAGVDARAHEPVEVLIARAGAVVARAARRQLGATYGARVVVVAGKGNNGADGRAAATVLARAGAAVTVVDASDLSPGAALPPADLVIDAAYGTGLRRPYGAPDFGGAPVLAVDIASGVSGLTGEVVGGDAPAVEAVRAATTVTFAALKPGLLLAQGPEHAGAVEVADIGLGSDVLEAARTWLVTDADVAAALPRRGRDAHKWQSAVRVIAGSPGMTGAAWMVSTAAMRAGAGYVRLSVPGADAGSLGLPPSEVVATTLPPDWIDAVVDDAERFGVLVVGPGLGRGGLGRHGETGEQSAVARLAVAAPVPVVIDADGLNALGSVEVLASITSARRHPTIITPHAGEYARLTGGPPGADRLAAVRDTARRSGAVVLLKGSVTVVAAPGGEVLMAAAGSARLATAGTGDVLSGVIGAFLARGLGALEAAAFAAHAHGRAAGSGRAEGLVATDLPDLISTWLSLLPPLPIAGASVGGSAAGRHESAGWYGKVGA